MAVRNRPVTKPGVSEPTKEISANGATELYRHFNDVGNLLYVGISLSAPARLAQHRSSSSWFHRIKTITIERFPTREEAIKAEKNAIREERPEHNIRIVPNALGSRTEVSLRVQRWRDKHPDEYRERNAEYQRKRRARLKAERESHRGGEAAETEKGRD